MVWIRRLMGIGAATTVLSCWWFAHAEPPRLQVGNAASTAAAPSSTAPGAALTERQMLEREAWVIYHVQAVRQLNKSEMQRQLGLNEAQIATAAELKSQGEQVFRGIIKLTGEERRQKFATTYSEVAKTVETRLVSTLNSKQQGQLRQIILSSQRGAIVFIMPGVSKDLRFTDRQQTELFAIVADSERQVDERQGNGLRAWLKLARVPGEAREKAEKILSGEQLRLWTDLRGEPTK